MIDVRPVEDRQAALIPPLHHDVPAGEADFGVDRDVVTLRRTGWRPSVAAPAPGAPGACAASFPAPFTAARGRRRCSRRGAIARIGGIAIGIARRHSKTLEDARRA